MHIEFILLVILFIYLRKNLPQQGVPTQWDPLLKGGLAASITFMVLETTVPFTRAVTEWIAHAMLVTVIYINLTRLEFKPVRSVVYAILPFVLINLLGDFTRLVSASFYKTWDIYFVTATTFAIVWLVAMLIINKRQRKALEFERKKTLEKEKEFIITQSLKAALEVQVTERTVELVRQKEELQKTIDELKATQAQLIQSEKMASLGELTAGIAHEIQNPLNFVNNFSEVNAELITEMKAAIESGNLEEAKAIATDIASNEQKINQHGKRADAIVKGMLQHSRSSSGLKEPTDINKLVDEYLRLAYHGLRAKDKSFNATLVTDYDERLNAGETGIGAISIIPQDIGRVVLNLITNAFYAAPTPPASGFKDPAYKHQPTVWVSTKKIGEAVEIRVRDNGPGIPTKILDKIFQPFFTTKPTGQGTGLGLSMSYDIVTKGHGGEIKVTTRENEGAEFIISLPI